MTSSTVVIKGIVKLDSFLVGTLISLLCYPSLYFYQIQTVLFSSFLKGSFLGQIFRKKQIRKYQVVEKEMKKDKITGLFKMFTRHFA